MIGHPVPRIDGDAKVTGRALYVDDLPAPPGLLHGATVRSAVAHGVLRAIRRDPAFDWFPDSSRVDRGQDEPVERRKPVVALITRHARHEAGATSQE